MTPYALVMHAAVAAPPGAPPLPYVERALVETSLEALPALLTPCVPVDAPAGLVRVTMWIERSGRLDVQSTTGTPDGGACWTAAIEGLAVPVHSGAPVEVAFVESPPDRWVDPLFLLNRGGTRPRDTATRRPTPDARRPARLTTRLTVVGASRLAQ